MVKGGRHCEERSNLIRQIKGDCFVPRNDDNTY